METGEEVNVIQLVIGTINDTAEQNGSPTFQDMVTSRIKSYATFTSHIMEAESRAAVDTIVDKNIESKELNDKVQQYIKLANRGLVSINPAEVIQLHVYHPKVQEISDADSAELLIDFSSPDLDDFYKLARRVVIGAAASQLLGGIKFWVDPDVLKPEQYALVHPISSTKH